MQILFIYSRYIPSAFQFIWSPSTDNKVHYVYKTTNLVNNKFYLGKHSQLGPVIDNYIGSGFIFDRAKRKYGFKSFKKEILYCYSSSNHALTGEKIIANANIVYTKECYNLKEGGRGGSGKGRKLSDSTCQKISIALSNRIWKDSSKFKISSKKKGQKHTLEAKLKMSMSLSGPNNPNYGKARSEETKKKIGDAQRGENSKNFGIVRDINSNKKTQDSLKKFYENNVSKSAKSVIVCGIEYPSLSHAGDALGLSRKVVTTRCMSKLEKHKEWYFKE